MRVLHEVSARVFRSEPHICVGRHVVDGVNTANRFAQHVLVLQIGPDEPEV